MIKKINLILLLLTCFFGISQKITPTLDDSIILEGESFIGFDNFSDHYYSKDNVFIKKSITRTWNYKNISLGKITSVDIINPLQIVLFYEDFNTAILLDNQLNEVQKIDFSKSNTAIIATNVRLSGRNHLWIYNSINQKLGLFDTTKNILNEFPIPIEGNIKEVHSDFNNFYWIDERNNFYSCNIFGKITLFGHIPNYKSVQIIDKEKLLFSEDNKLYLIDFDKETKIEIEIVENSLDKFYYKDQILAIFTDQQITNYKINLP